jgi:hypothetical protein
LAYQDCGTHPKYTFSGRRTTYCILFSAAIHDASAPFLLALGAFSFSIYLPVCRLKLDIDSGEANLENKLL